MLLGVFLPNTTRFDKHLRVPCVNRSNTNVKGVFSKKHILENQTNISLDIIDNYEYDGDYIESQAFGYLAIRSFLNLPTSFPKTTGCDKPTVGGKIVENF